MLRLLDLSLVGEESWVIAGEAMIREFRIGRVATRLADCAG